MERTISEAQIFALRIAARRERGNIRPVLGPQSVADNIVAALDRRGFVTWDGEPDKSAPRINDAGRAVVAEWDALT
jgi:hypothetical protein